MVWHDLLFAHWPVAPEILRPAVPAPLELDLHGGEAWLAVVPFTMSGIRPRGLPAVPGLSRFPELNLRTYVRYGDANGVHFFSLDADQALAVRIARWGFGLPYHRAAMSARRGESGWIEYRSLRRDAATSLRCRYRPTGSVLPAAAPGTLEHFLTERYGFLTVDRRGRVHHGAIAHAPWPLQPAEWQVEDLRMTEQIGVDRPRQAPILHYTAELPVRAWLPRRLF